MEPLAAPQRVPPGPPRPPAPPTTGDGPPGGRPPGWGPTPGPSPRPRRRRRWHPWTFLRESRNELRKVAWPDRFAVRRNSTTVALILTGAVLALGLVSLTAAWAFGQLLP